jgi:hypothetical protein
MKRKSGNVLQIAPKDELAAKEKLELEAQAAISNLEPLAHPVVPAQLHQGRGHRRPAERVRWPRWGVREPAASPQPVECTRQRDRRAAHQPAVRVRHPLAARTGAGADHQARHPGAPGADRGAHRRGRPTLSASRWASSWAARTCAASAVATPVKRRQRQPRRLGGSYERRRSPPPAKAGSNGLTTCHDRSSSICRRNTINSARARSLPSFALAVQLRGQPLPEPGAVRAGSRWQGQDRVQPAGGDRRPDQGADRAGHRVRLPAGHVQRRHRRSRSARPTSSSR